MDGDGETYGKHHRASKFVVALEFLFDVLDVGHQCLYYYH